MSGRELLATLALALIPTVALAALLFIALSSVT
jgi:hypothetical protein